MQRLKFCFLPLLRSELQRVTQHWNLHKIRPSTYEESPHGRPDVFYFLPETDCTTSYLNNVPDLEIEVAMDVFCEDPGEDVS